MYVRWFICEEYICYPRRRSSFCQVVITSLLQEGSGLGFGNFTKFWEQPFLSQYALLPWQLFILQEPELPVQLFSWQKTYSPSPPFTMLNAERDRRSSAWRTVSNFFIVWKLLRVNNWPSIIGYSFNRRKLQIIFTKKQNIFKKCWFFCGLCWICFKCVIFYPITWRADNSDSDL